MSWGVPWWRGRIGRATAASLGQLGEGWSDAIGVETAHEPIFFRRMGHAVDLSLCLATGGDVTTAQLSIWAPDVAASQCEHIAIGKLYCPRRRPMDERNSANAARAIDAGSGTADAPPPPLELMPN